jgi:transposase
VQEGVQVVGVWEEEGNIVLQVEVKPETICPLCGEGKLHGHGKLRERRVHHQFLSGKWMFLSFTPRRFRCPHCRRTTTLRPPSLRPWARFTQEAIHQVLATTWRMSFVAVAQLFSLTPGRVLRLLARYVPLSFPWKGGEGEVILTMDELSFRGKDLVGVLGTLVPERRVLRILRDDRKETLKRCLEDLKRKGMKVQACVVDMRETFRRAVQEVFPEAEVILDPFHLIQDANRRLDEARKIA